MTDLELANLRFDIQSLMVEVMNLQKIHRQETGCDFVIYKSTTSMLNDVKRLEEE